MRSSYNKTYWGNLPPKELVDEALDKVKKYYDFLNTYGRLALYTKSLNYYYRPVYNGASLRGGGEQGEMTLLSVNDYRSILASIESMTTSQNIAFQPKSTNSDVSSESQTQLATSILDYYLREKKLNQNFITSVKDALIFGEGFLRVNWNAVAGEPAGENPDGTPVYEGDVEYTNYNPLNVIRDFARFSSKNDRWYILRDFEDKYELADKFDLGNRDPQLRDDILSCSADMLETSRSTTLAYDVLQNSDNIPVYTLIHNKTAACPQGRYFQFLANGAVLLDTPLPYDSAHIYRIAATEQNGTIFGFSVAFDLLPIQQMSDIVHSTVATNQTTFGVQNVIVPKGSDISVSQVAGGLNFLEVDQTDGEVKPLNLTSTPPEIFEHMSILQKNMEVISGVNSVVRGQPEASLKSGAALALVQSQAIQSNQPLERSYIQLIEDVGTGTINLIKDFANTQRIITICGKSNESLTQQFSGEDVSNVSRVLVDVGSPMSRTLAGKIQISETLIQNGMIDNIDQYINLLKTGNLDGLTNSKSKELLYINQENELLMKGKPQTALITDDHKQHLAEHQALLFNSHIRNGADNSILISVMNHMKEHMNFMQDPYGQWVQTVLNNQVVPSPQQPMNGSPQEVVDPTASQPEDPMQPNLPNPPQGTDPRSAEVINQQKLTQG